jgi:methyl-accepting chemotaxis protein
MNSSIRSKLTFLIGGAIILVLCASLIAIWQLKRQINAYSDLLENEIRFEREIKDLNYLFKLQVQEWKNLLLRGADAEKNQKYWSEFGKLDQQINRATEELLPQIKEYEKPYQIISEFYVQHKQLLALYEKGKIDFTKANFDHKVGDAAVTGIDRIPSQLLNDASTEIAKIAKETNEKITAHSTVVINWTLIALVVMSAGIFFGTRFFVNSSLIQPLLLICSHLSELSNGKFKNKLQLESTDELGAVNKSINQLQDAIISMLTTLKTSSKLLTDSAYSLTDINRSVEATTRDTNLSTDQIAAAINEMAMTVQEVASNASNAARSATSADDDSKKSLSVMNNAISSIRILSDDVDKVSAAMNKLEEDTTRIGGVLDVIKNVAEQTNLLALNAAIEAARAGEQGRGFAVVADEVRSLAKRTQESTAEIQQIIEAVQSGAISATNAMRSSQGKTKQTTELAIQAGEGIKSISEQISLIQSMNTQIATAAEEQSYASEEINRNVVRVVELIESNSSNIIQSSEIAALLKHTSDEINVHLNRYQV